MVFHGGGNTNTRPDLPPVPPPRKIDDEEAKFRLELRCDKVVVMVQLQPRRRFDLTQNVSWVTLPHKGWVPHINELALFHKNPGW